MIYVRLPDGSLRAYERHLEVPAGTNPRDLFAVPPKNPKRYTRVEFYPATKLYCTASWLFKQQMILVGEVPAGYHKIDP